MPQDRMERDEVAAALAARRELGPAYELEIAEGLVDRVNALIDARLKQVEQRNAPKMDWAQMVLGIASLALSIPLVAISLAVNDGANGYMALFVLGTVLVVNLAYAVRNRRD